ncbi:hypothetical protein [Hafnia alvei]|uniref:hypothetical protein n=1 Tax=Hafnia alvei TaxID=569 RepID=UPI000B709646|nr:hypothetical protein [Hafnia alvei]
MNERDLSLIKALGEEVSVLLREAESRHQKALDAVNLVAEEKMQQMALRIKNLEDREQPDFSLLISTAVKAAVAEIEPPAIPALPDIPLLIDEAVKAAVAEVELPAAPVLPDISPMVDEAVKTAVSAIELPAIPELPDIPLLIDEAVKAAVSAVELPVPVPGKDGADALQLEVLPDIDVSKNYLRGTYATHNGGLWRTYEKSHGMRGWECLVDGIAAVDIQQTDERNFTVDVKRASGNIETKAFSFPVQIYREVFETGKRYQPGDTVTWGGSLWHCNEVTEDKPGDIGAKGWVLAVKKGRDLREKKT